MSAPKSIDDKFKSMVSIELLTSNAIRIMGIKDKNTKNGINQRLSEN